MKIITLIENLVYKSGLLAEHGLAILIDTGNSKILFDTGQSPAFLKNAGKLGIDLKGIDKVIISHGHFDHTGGLSDFLRINNKAKVYAKKEIFSDKYKNGEQFIGIPHNLDRFSDRFLFVESTLEIDPGIFIIPDIPLEHPADKSFSAFNIKVDQELIPDDFRDELFLAVIRDHKISVLSSCSHRGISNIMEAAKNQFNLDIRLVLGGFHLRDAGEVQYNTVMECFRSVKPDHIGTCHCTGIHVYSRLRSDLGEKVFYNATGNMIEL